MPPEMTAAEEAIRVALSGISPRAFERETLRARVLDEMLRAGFELEETGLLRLPGGDDPKDVARRLHMGHRDAVLDKNGVFIADWEDKVLDHFADGAEVDPGAIEPRIVPVQTEPEAALFRFASLHWSVPVSQGYGRRSRFLVFDQANGKLMGIFALGDPVFNLAVRDQLIGWTQLDRRKRLYNVYDAYVMGAVEPYRGLIGGKLISMCAVADETAQHLVQKYTGTETEIWRVQKRPEPVLITTTSSLGRSSIYNRLKYKDRWLFRSVGFTEGFGHFHFSDEVFDAIVKYVAGGSKELRGNKYGEGPNWRIRTLRRGLNELGLNPDLLRHGVRREVFLAPRALGWRAYLRGESEQVRLFSFPLGDLAEFWRTRWAIPRAERDGSFRLHTREEMRLTPQLARSGVPQQLRLG